mgnify:CR=1 FL=1
MADSFDALLEDPLDGYLVCDNVCPLLWVALTVDEGVATVWVNIVYSEKFKALSEVLLDDCVTG